MHIDSDYIDIKISVDDLAISFLPLNFTHMDLRSIVLCLYLLAQNFISGKIMLCDKKAVFRYFEKTVKKKKVHGYESNSPNGITVIGFRQ